MPPSKRFPGWNAERWAAEKKRLKCNDKFLYELCMAEARSRIRSREARRFFRSSQIGAPKLD